MVAPKRNKQHCECSLCLEYKSKRQNNTNEGSVYWTIETFWKIIKRGWLKRKRLEIYKLTSASMLPSDDEGIEEKRR